MTDRRLHAMPQSPHSPHAVRRPRRALAVASLSLALAACGSAEASQAPPTHAVTKPFAAMAGGGCTTVVDATLNGIAQRIYGEAVSGRNVAGSVARLARSRALAKAVARDNRAATRAALRPRLRAEIQRIVVMRGQRVLAQLGHGAALAPVHGVIRDAARAPVGRYTMSLGDDQALANLIHGLTGAEVVMRAGGHQVASTLGTVDGRLPAAGTATLSGATYAVSSLRGTAFPSGLLRIWLLEPQAGSECGATQAATVVNTLGAVAERLLQGETDSPQTKRVPHVVASDPRFVRAVADDDPAAVRAEIIRFFRDPSLHVVRIRAVDAHGALVNDVGGPYVIAPASTTLRRDGRAIGRVTLSIQDDTGYIKLMHRFTGADVILRTPAGQVPGSTLSPGPGAIRSRGTVAYAGRTYQACAFTATAFPSEPLQISILVPAA